MNPMTKNPENTSQISHPSPTCDRRTKYEEGQVFQEAARAPGPSPNNCNDNEGGGGKTTKTKIRPESTANANSPKSKEKAKHQLKPTTTIITTAKSFQQ